MLKQENSFGGAAPFSPCGSGFWTNVLKLGSSHLYSLSRLLALSSYGKFLEAVPEVSILTSCLCSSKGSVASLHLELGSTSATCWLARPGWLRRRSSSLVTASSMATALPFPSCMKHKGLIPGDYLGHALTHSKLNPRAIIIVIIAIAVIRANVSS